MHFLISIKVIIGNHLLAISKTLTEVLNVCYQFSIVCVEISSFPMKGNERSRNDIYINEIEGVFHVVYFVFIHGTWFL